MFRDVSNLYFSILGFIYCRTGIIIVGNEERKSCIALINIAQILSIGYCIPRFVAQKSALSMSYSYIKGNIVAHLEKFIQR